MKAQDPYLRTAERAVARVTSEGQTSGTCTCEDKPLQGTKSRLQLEGLQHQTSSNKHSITLFLFHDLFRAKQIQTASAIALKATCRYLKGLAKLRPKLRSVLVLAKS